MRIGEVARAAGVGVETVRFYERKGLIDRPPKPMRGTRSYPSATVARIRFIRQARGLGFSLAEIAGLLALSTAPDTDCSAIRSRAAAKLDEVRAKRRLLARMEAILEELVEACPNRGGLGDCPILAALNTEEVPVGEGESPA